MKSTTHLRGPEESESFSEGHKFDNGKTRYDLVPPESLEEFAKVLTFGARKYGPENWKLVDNLENRYFAAAQRHLWAFKKGEYYDDESGYHHLAHAMCCLAFILEIDLKGKDREYA